MIWLLALSFYIVATVFAADENSRSSYFRTVENWRLAEKVAKTFYSPSVLSCSLACLRNTWCSSTNFKNGTGGTGVCELIKHESNSTNHNNKIIHQPGNTYTIILKVSKCSIFLRNAVKDIFVTIKLFSVAYLTERQVEQQHLQAHNNLLYNPNKGFNKSLNIRTS